MFRVSVSVDSSVGDIVDEALMVALVVLLTKR